MPLGLAEGTCSVAAEGSSTGAIGRGGTSEDRAAAEVCGFPGDDVFRPGVG